MSKSDHITNCSKCDMTICSYCVEDCSGCGNETCFNCYQKHQTACFNCDVRLCPEEVNEECLCAVCEMKNDV